MSAIPGNNLKYSATAPEYQEYWNCPVEEAPPAYSAITPQEQYWNDNIEPILSEHERQYQDITNNIKDIKENMSDNYENILKEYNIYNSILKSLTTAILVSSTAFIGSLFIPSFFWSLFLGILSGACFLTFPGVLLEIKYNTYCSNLSKDFSKIKEIKDLEKEQVKLAETIKYINEHVKGQLFNDFMGTYRYLDSANGSDIEVYEKMLPVYARFKNEHKITNYSQDTIMNCVRSMHAETRRIFDKWVFLKEQGFKHSQSENVLKILTRIFNGLSETETLRTIELGNN